MKSLAVPTLQATAQTEKRGIIHSGPFLVVGLRRPLKLPFNKWGNNNPGRSREERGLFPLAPLPVKVSAAIRPLSSLIDRPQHKLRKSIATKWIIFTKSLRSPPPPHSHSHLSLVRRPTPTGESPQGRVLWESITAFVMFLPEDNHRPPPPSFYAGQL